MQLETIIKNIVHSKNGRIGPWIGVGFQFSVKKECTRAIEPPISIDRPLALTGEYPSSLMSCLSKIQPYTEAKAAPIRANSAQEKIQRSPASSSCEVLLNSIGIKPKKPTIRPVHFLLVIASEKIKYERSAEIKGDKEYIKQVLKEVRY